MVKCPKCGETFSESTVRVIKPPKSGTVTGQVWEACHTLRRDLNRVPKVKEVMDHPALNGFNPFTVMTQYRLWTKWVATLEGQTVEAPSGS